jgi:hypothetical protein
VTVLLRIVTDRESEKSSIKTHIVTLVTDIYRGRSARCILVSFVVSDSMRLVGIWWEWKELNGSEVVEQDRRETDKPHS